ncbi:GntR family transcriptional regulator [Actinomadura soli]|uniref:GntR family transcriptional regulator n=1 Tax=Actinomadura soli TaxID=2508997 RepID=A0A5C4JG67_9ACTN|nr:GntR family transcriptional regulator [Actinomadura soli]TMR04311.1 GntR family transcriptional regulator [Actinomadura soli]
MAAVDLVYETLREQIISGVLPPGAKLGEEELAASLGVSRTPVREALRRIASEGLIETAPNRGSWVRTWSDDELRSLFSARALLEGYAARLAAPRITKDEVRHLSALCDAMEAAQHRDLASVTALNDEFHTAIREASGDPVVPGLLAGLIQVPVVARTFRSYNPERMAHTMTQHRELVAALASGSTAWAEAAMSTHVLSAGNWLLNRYAESRLPADATGAPSRSAVESPISPTTASNGVEQSPGE